MTFVPAHYVVGSADAPNLAFVLHGILGSAQNLQGFIRKLQAVRPDWVFVLSDVRGHAGSLRAPGPHTVQACAEDLQRLELVVGRKPRTVIGHSFGGKVCLKYAQSAGVELQQLWLLDTAPGTVALDEGSEVQKVIAAATSVSQPISNRSEVSRAMREYGLPDRIGSWMTTNLRRVSDHYEWTLDFEAVKALLLDYSKLDFWPFLQSEKRALQTHWVIAEHSDRINAQQRARGMALPASANLSVHILADAGHWLHVDNPTGLTTLMQTHLPG